MIESLKQTALYKSLKISSSSHAFLFFSSDKILNNEIAKVFAQSLLCENHVGCGKCASCKQFKNRSHPDLLFFEQDSIKVDDIKNLIDKLSTKPVFSSKKVVLILNAETINEISQNKILKSLEEPNESVVFVFTTSKLDKLLPTVLSRLNKIEVPSISYEDKLVISPELEKSGSSIVPIIKQNFNLTESLNLCGETDYFNTLQSVFNLLDNLNTTADIPIVVSKLADIDKTLFLTCLQDVFIEAVKDSHKFNEKDLVKVKLKYSNNAVIKILPLIDNAFKYLSSNVNFNYILDNLLFNILKEKFLCN